MMHETTERDGLAQEWDSTRDKGWTYVRVVSVMAGCGYTSTLLAADCISGMIGWGACAIGITVMILSVVAIRFPMPTAIAQMLLWACINAMPSLTGLSWISLPSFAVTLMLVSFRYTVPGTVTGLVQSITTVISHTVLGLSSTNPSLLLSMITVVAFPVAVCIGVGMRCRIDRMHMRRICQELGRRRELDKERQHRESIAADLHDQVTNRLAYQILRMQHDAQMWEDHPPHPEQYRAEISELLEISQNLLERIRATIDVLGTQPSPVVHELAKPTNESVFDFDTEHDMLDMHLSQVRQEMRELGFTVHTQLLDDMPSTYNPAALDLIHTAIDEFANNMIKYADPAEECRLEVDVRVNDITVRTSNIRGRKLLHQIPAMSGGRGLAQLRKQADAINGNLSRECHGMENRFRLTIPWFPHHPVR